MDIDGKIHAKNLREKIKKEIIDLKEKLKKTPKQFYSGVDIKAA